MTLHVQAYGDGPPLVLMHGLFGSGDNLRILARELEKQFTVYLPDLPNHGKSPHLDSSTHEAMAREVETFLSEERITSPVIGGHSIGGKIAMLMALRNPDRYTSLISIDIAPRRYEASHREILAAMKELDLGSLSSRRDADSAMESAVPSAQVRSFLLKNLIREDDGYSWQLNLEAITADYDQLLGWEPPAGSYERPALFVGGEHSSYLQAERDRETIRHWFPRAQLAMIGGAGHWLHADKSDELLKAMNEFLERTATA